MATPDLTLVSESTLPAHLDATLTSAKGYADTKKNEAIAAASSDATTKANAAESDAIADATVKYGGLPGKVADLEDRVAIKSLGDTHLDTVTEPGDYMQLSSSSATEANGYPATGGTAGKAGPLNVTTHSGMVYQTYHMILGGAVFGRYQSPSGTWFPWESVGKIQVVPLGDADLDTVTDGAFFAQQFNEGATEARNYPPDSGAGFLIPVNLGGGVVYHLYVNPLMGKIWTRRKYISSWSEWVPAGGDIDQFRDEYIAADTLILADAKAYTDSKPSGVTQAELESSATATRNLAIAGDQTLSDRADGQETRLEALEVLGELTPGDVSDATNQALLANPASGTAQGVSSKIFGEVADPGTETGAYLEGTFMRTDQALGRFPTSTGVRRLITDPNARAVLQPGDFLLASPSPTHRTSFYKTPVGAPVKGWTPRWGSTVWTVEADTESLGEKVLSGVAPSGTSLLTFDKTPTAKDVEVLARWKATAGAANLRVLFHTSDDYATRNGHTIYLGTTGTISWWTWVDGVASGGTGASIDPLPAGEWWITRTRFYNQSMYFKAWPDTQPEPSEWSATVPRSTVLPEGRIGIGSGGPGTLHVDWATLTLNGGIAPDMEA